MPHLEDKGRLFSAIPLSPSPFFEGKYWQMYMKERKLLYLFSPFFPKQWSYTKSKLIKHDSLCLGVVAGKLGEVIRLQDCDESNTEQVSSSL